MLLDNSYKSSCKFAEDVIAYLYGEIETPEKLRFENHLTGCNSCTDELAGFSNVRSAVLEWRTEEFSSLATPVIEIPYEKNAEVRYLADVEGVRSSWFSRIGDLFRFPNKFVPLAAGFAVLTICAGLLFYAVSLQNDGSRVAHNDNKNASNVKIVSPPTNETEQYHPNVASVDKKAPQSPDEAVKTPKTNVSTDSASPVKVSLPSNPAKTNKSTKPGLNTSAKAAVKTADKTAKSRRPSLTDSDDDDDSLRLSDLFEEVSIR